MSEDNNKPKNTRLRAKRKKSESFLTKTFWVLILVLFAMFINFVIQQNTKNANPELLIPTVILSPIPSISPSPTQTLTDIPPTVTIESTAVIIPPTATPVPENILDGMMVLSISEAGYYHLFAIQPGSSNQLRLSSGEVNDVAPALSPDGSKVAFNSDRGDQADIFILDLLSGETTQISNSIASEGNPTWSPNGLWLAYERSQNGNLDIVIQIIDDSIPPVQISFDQAPDFSPSWNADSKTISFTSNRNGNFDIWAIDIEKIGSEGYLQAITIGKEDHREAVWSPDGKQIAWSAPHQGLMSIFIADAELGESSARFVGIGGSPSWDPSGKYISASRQNSQNNEIIVYDLDDGDKIISRQSISGTLNGFSWGQNGLPEILPKEIQKIADQIIPAPWEASSATDNGLNYGRQNTIQIEDLSAPNPEFNALVVPTFLSLRDRLIDETGWDVLAVLENAFVPLTQDLPPGNTTSWLYTGRAFALNQDSLNYGWMTVVREDFGEETYWRLYLRTLLQDGSQGEIMTAYPWNFDVRIVGEEADLGEGGIIMSSIPEGYWVDFTTIAEIYGWHRQPALSNWRSYYPGIQFNLFAATDDLAWEDAMLQLYPSEIFMDPISETIP